MSVVAVKKYDNKIVISADSIMVRGYSKDTRGNFSKINSINDMIVGSSGYAEETSLMWHYARTHKPDSATEKDILNFIVEFANWKRGITGESNILNNYLIVFDGHVFEIENMFVYEIQDYESIGAGRDFANAALYLGHSPKEAVAVACELSCYVAEPIIEYQMDLDK